MPKPLIAASTIYREALRLLDEGGADALNARNLAAALKCSTRTLYQQVGKRDEMIKGLFEYYFSGLSLELEESATWQECVVEWAATLRGALLAHPNLSGLIGVEHRGPVIHYVERLLSVFLQSGFEEDLAVRSCRSLANVVISLSLTEIKIPDTGSDGVLTTGEKTEYDQELIAIKGSSLQNPPEGFNNTIDWIIRGVELERGR